MGANQSQDILLAHPAAPAGAVHGAEINVVLGGDPGHDRGVPPVCGRL